MPREKISARPRSKSTWTCDGLAADWPRCAAVVDCAAWAKAPVENTISHAAVASFIGNLCICGLFVEVILKTSPRLFPARRTQSDPAVPNLLVMGHRIVNWNWQREPLRRQPSHGR